MEKEINIKNILNIIKRRFWVVMLFTIFSTISGGLYTIYFTTPLYQASTTVILKADSTELFNTLKVLIRDPAVLVKVIDELNLSSTPEMLSSQISVESIEGSQVIRIYVTDSNPKNAARVANTTAKIFKSESNSILNFPNITILSEAKENPWPINENNTKIIIIAFVAGLVLGIGLTFFLNSIDDTFKTEGEVENILDIPVLGSVSKMNKKNTFKKLAKDKTKQVGNEIRGETLGS